MNYGETDHYCMQCFHENNDAVVKICDECSFVCGECFRCMCLQHIDKLCTACGRQYCLCYDELYGDALF